MTHPNTTKAKFGRVLIANRGEIAVRIIRACRELGLETVAVYSTADAGSKHRHMANYAVHLPGEAPADTYLNIDLLTKAIKDSGAGAVHPGYGFLSESAIFNEAVVAAGAKFIGPDVSAMHKMGDKIEARRLMEANGVPMVPGCKDPLTDPDDLKAKAKEIGYPMILKAAAGGGGRGMRVVRQESELADALAACQREAQAYFGNPAVFCERFIENPRHIEYQVLFDEHGNGVHLFERDCSVQRRHQKLFEEAPSAFLDEEHRARLGEIAVKAAAAANYQGAGTVEFICDSPDQAFFMEMNTRIQVEHPVTEMITGVDLIQWQLRVAQGEKLPFKQSDLQVQGWAMEARINAEDASCDFMPSPGKINNVSWPMGPFVRVETYLEPGSEIPAAYDSMVAKLLVWGRDRDDALARMSRALLELKVDGPPTTANFHAALIRNPKFCSGEFTTRFLEEEADYFKAIFAGESEDDASEMAALQSSVAAAVLAADAVAPPGSSRLAYEARQKWLQVGRRDGIHEGGR